MTKKALIIIDMLNDFVDESGALYCGKPVRDIIGFIQKRLEVYRKAGDPVIYLQDSHTPDDKEFDLFPPHGVRGTWGAEIIDELAPQAGEFVLPKTRFSGFYGTSLEKVLKDAGAVEVEVVGVCTSICVMDTVGGLVDRDYTPIVPVRGVADFDPEAHEFALKRMQKIYGARILP